jgi:hypothetical protein
MSETREDGSPSIEKAPYGTLREWWRGAPLPRDLTIVLGLVLPVMLAAANLWLVHRYTVDDSYISYRYARNLVKGLGLVYNAGERIEGYTNFLWTLILAGGIELGIDPDVLAKGLGASSAFGTIGLTYLLSGKLLPYATAPCTATWLLASTIVLTGWSVFGLETGFFVCLVLAGTYLFFLENPELTPAAVPARAVSKSEFPWSGVVFALAGLTRPEAPLFLGLLMLFLGRRFFGKKNLVRGAVFVGPLVLHLLWRRSYYGAWLPNTFTAKTGNLDWQLAVGLRYVLNYVSDAGFVVYLAVIGAAVGLLQRRRDILAITAVTVATAGYVVLVGGDWMKGYRFMAPFEPFCFLLVDLGLRRTIDRRDGPINLALVVFAASIGIHRASVLRATQVDLMQQEKRFWDMAGQGTSRWLLIHERGEVAIGDIGYVGWATDYPILDMLGLVDPVISKLPGGYTRKIGPGYMERLYDKKPRYYLMISSTEDCMQPSTDASRLFFYDRRFHEQYELGGKVLLERGFAWCIFERRAL